MHLVSDGRRKIGLVGRPKSTLTLVNTRDKPLDADPMTCPTAKRLEKARGQCIPNVEVLSYRLPITKA